MKDTTKRILRFAAQIAAVGLLVWIDRIIKNAAAAGLYGKGTKVLVKGFLGLCYAENTGAAFSMFNTSTDVLSAVTGVIMAAALVLLFVIKNKPKIYDICVPLIIAGGMGNLLDRLTRGYVIDYIRTLFIDFPIFNFADILITCSCGAVIIYLIYEMITDTKKEKAKKAAEFNGQSDVSGENRENRENGGDAE